jgi:hypothetical protein
VVKVGIGYQAAHHFTVDTRPDDAHCMNELRWAGWSMFEMTLTTLRGAERT